MNLVTAPEQVENAAFIRLSWSQSPGFLVKNICGDWCSEETFGQALFQDDFTFSLFCLSKV